MPKDASCQAQGLPSLSVSEALPGHLAQGSFFTPYRSIRTLLWLPILGSIALVGCAGVVAALLGD